MGGEVHHSKALHDSKLKKKDFDDVIATLHESEAIEIKCILDKGITKTYYVLKATNINLEKFKIPAVHTIPPILQCSTGKEINNINNININKYNIDMSDLSIGEEENWENWEEEEILGDDWGDNE